MNSAGMNPNSAQATAVRVKLLWVVQVRALEADNKLICDEFKFHWESGVRSLPAHGLTQSRSSDSWGSLPSQCGESGSIIMSFGPGVGEQRIEGGDGGVGG